MNLYDLVTKQDLNAFKEELLSAIKAKDIFEDKEYLRPNEAAKFLNISISTLRNYREAGYIAALKVDPNSKRKSIWFKKEDLVKFIESKR